MTEGTLSGDELDRVWAHVDGCARCADIVAHLGATQPPAKRGRYELGEALGAGGMGVVYAAWDPQLRRRVALKLVHPDSADPNAHARMLREARSLARISHPNVVAVYDVGEEGGEIYLATELVDGETLTTWQRGKPAEQIVDAWLQVARGLAAAHKEGVVHRDVKPANCMVGRDGRVRVGDFGLAREPYAAPLAEDLPQVEHAVGTAAHDVEPEDPDATHSSQAMEALSSDARAAQPLGGPAVTAAGKVVGTLGYMPPEQRRGVIDPRSDQFALCVALAEALTGERPRANASVDFAPLPALGPVLTRGLASRAHKRYASMDELAGALAAVLVPAGVGLAGAPPSGHRRWLGAAVSVVAVLGLVAMLVARLRSGTSEASCEQELPAAAWSAARRSEAVAHLPANVAHRLDGYAARWRGAARAVCAAKAGSFARTRGPRCLGDAAKVLEARLTKWLSERARDATTLQVELDDLPEPKRCAGEAWLVAEATPAQRAADARLRARLGARQLDDDKLAEATKLTAELAREAVADGTAAFAGEVAEELAVLAKRQGEPAIALEALRAVAARAVAAKDPATEVRMALAMVPLVGAESVEPAVALADAARGALVRAGGDELAEARLSYAVAQVWGARRRWDEAAPLYERARGAFRAAYGAESHAEAMCTVGLAGAYQARAPQSALALRTWDEARAMIELLGEDVPMPTIGAPPQQQVAYLREVIAKIEEQFPGSETLAYAEYALAASYVLALDDESALVHYRKQIELADRLDLRDAQRADGLAQAAIILIERGRPDEAAPLAERAIEVAKKLDARSELAVAYKALGWALLERGDPTAARAPLERALTLQDKLEVPAQHRGFTRFLLARSLAKTAPARARELATAARADFTSALEVLDTADPGLEAQRKMSRERLALVEAFLARR